MAVARDPSAAAPAFRFGGWVVDSAPFVALGLLWTRAVHGVHALDQALHGVLTKNVSSTLLPTKPTLHVLVWSGGLMVLVGAFVVYRVVVQSRSGMTAGRWLMGTRLVTTDHSPLTAAHCWKRLGVVQGLGLVPVPGTGALSVLWAVRDAEWRTLADRAAGTRVIRSDITWYADRSSSLGNCPGSSKTRVMTPYGEPFQVFYEGVDNRAVSAPSGASQTDSERGSS